MPTADVRLKYRIEMKGAREYDVPAIRFGMAEATYTGTEDGCWIFEARIAYRNTPAEIKVVRTREDAWGETDTSCIGKFVLNGEESVEIDWSGKGVVKAAKEDRSARGNGIFMACAGTILLLVLAASYFALTTPDADGPTGIAMILFFSAGPALTLGFVLGTRGEATAHKVVLALAAAGMVANLYLCASPQNAQLLFFAMNAAASAVTAVLAFMLVRGITGNGIHR